MEDDLELELLMEAEQQYAARQQQQCLQAAPPSAWQTGTGHQQPAQQPSWVQQPTPQHNTPQQQAQHVTQQGYSAWPNQQAPVWTKQTQGAPWAPAAKPFAPHNSTKPGSLQQQSMGQLQGQQQQSWQMQQSCLNQTVQGVRQPQAQQQMRPPAATMYEHPAQQRTTPQHQQQHVYCGQPQQGSVLQPSQQHSNQQQLQQQTTLNRLTHAPHHAGGSTQQVTSTVAAGGAASGPAAATKASSHGNASLRPNARPVVHLDDKMLPYQQQPAVQQRKHAAQQQHKGSKQQLQSSGQTSIHNLFPVDHLKQQQIQEQRQQQQQALHKRQQQQQQLAQASAARQKQLQHQSHKQSTSDLVEDVDIVEILSDEEAAGQALAAASDPFQAQQQQQQQCHSWDVPHHQQQPAQQLESCHQQSNHPPHHHHQQQQRQQQHHKPQQRSKPQVQTVDDPQEVLRLMAMAWPGAGEADGISCPSQELSDCPASTAKGDTLGAPGRRVNAAAAKTWLYPAGSVREYQYQIAYTAIKYNTLACLPTGLGKTLIAAVVMYNFYRWFPRAKIAFVAPTRPLVEQQLEECQRIMGFDKNDAAKLLSTPAAKRRELWTSKRIFFSTPQTLENDLKTGACPSSGLVCLVVDECHRATGDHAMANVVKLLRQSGEKFRVLALSATPGNDHRAIQEVIKNMLINKVDFRSEDDDSIKQYCHQRTVETCVVPVSHEAKLIQQQLLTLMHPLVMELNRTCQANLTVPNERKLLCQHSVLEARRRHQASGFSTKPNSTASRSTKPIWAKGNTTGSLNSLNPNSGGDFSYQVAIEWEALSIITRVADAFEDRGANAALEQVYTVQQEADAAAGAAAAAKVAGGLYAGSGSGGQRTGRLAAAALGKLRSQGAYNDLVERLKVLSAHPHPKLQHLGDQLQHHFTLQQQQQAEGPDSAADISRAIVFCSYRDQVSMLAQYLRQFEPEIVCRPFVGQGNSTKKGGKAAAAGSSGGGRRKVAAAAAADGSFADDADADDPALVGMKQAEQKRVLEDFRAGEFNVLLATCIGEEGLDIPQVDLIVCWDSGGNPSRARQRMGRTGRSRPGHVVYLLSEGKELEKYQSNLEREKQVKEYLRCADQRFELSHQEVPLLPPNITPIPTLITIPQPPGKATHKARGSKRKTSTADADEAVPAAAAARKRPGKKGQQQQQQLGYSHSAAAAAGDSAALGMGYAALKRARAVSKAKRVVESSEDGWESEETEQQQQQQVAWQAGAAGASGAAAAAVAADGGGGCTVEQVYEWERDQPNMDLDDGDGDAFVDGAEDHDAAMPPAAVAAAAATVPTWQQQQRHCVVRAAESDNDVDVDVALATRKQRQQQQGIFGGAELDSALDMSLAARKQLQQQQQRRSLGSDGDIDIPLSELAKKKKKKKKQQQYRQARGGIDRHESQSDLDTPLIVRQQQAEQRQQPAKKAVKKLVSRKTHKAAAAGVAGAGVGGVMHPTAHCSPSADIGANNTLSINPVVGNSSSGGVAAQAKQAAAAAVCRVGAAAGVDGAAGIVSPCDADNYDGDINDDEYCQLIEYEQAQQHQEPVTSPKAAAAAGAAGRAAGPAGPEAAAAAAAAQVFSFDAVNGKFMLGPRATAVLLPHNGWLTKQLMQQQQQQQQQQCSPAATAAVSCVPETRLSAAAAGGTSAVAAGVHLASRQPAAAAAAAGLGAGGSVAKVLSGLLDQLMEPMSVAEMKVAAAQLGDHPLAGLALLPRQLGQQQQQQCGPADDIGRSHPGKTASSPAAAAAVAEVQQASQDSMDVTSDPDDDGVAANTGVHDTAAAAAAAAVPWRVKTREEMAAAARAACAAAAATEAAKSSAAVAGDTGIAAEDVAKDGANDLLEDIPLAQRLQHELAAAAAAGSRKTGKHKLSSAKSKNQTTKAAGSAAVGKKGKAVGGKRGKQQQQQQQQQQGGSQSDGLGDLPLALLPAAYPAAARAARRRPTAAAAAAAGIAVPVLQEEHVSVMQPAAEAVAAGISNNARQQGSDTAADTKQQERPAERAHGAAPLAGDDEANDADEVLEDVPLAQRKDKPFKSFVADPATVAVQKLPCTAKAAAADAAVDAQHMRQQQQQQGPETNTRCAVVVDRGDGADDGDDFLQDVPIAQTKDKPFTADPISVGIEMPIIAAKAAAGDALDPQQSRQQQQQQQHQDAQQHMLDPSHQVGTFQVAAAGGGALDAQQVQRQQQQPQHQDAQQQTLDPSHTVGSCQVAAAAGGAQKLTGGQSTAPAAAAAAAADSTDDGRGAEAAEMSVDAKAAHGQQQQQQLAALAHAVHPIIPQEQHQQTNSGCIALQSPQRQCDVPDVPATGTFAAAAAAGDSLQDPVRQSSLAPPPADAGVVPPPAAGPPSAPPAAAAQPSLSTTTTAAAAAVKSRSAAAAAAAAADLSVTGAATALHTAAAAAAGSPDSWSDDDLQQQQQQPKPQPQPSWRSLSGLGRNRSRAIRRQQQFAASWDDVCSQPARKHSDTSAQQTAPITTANAAAAAELAGVSADAFVRPAAAWDDFFTQPQQQQQRNKEDNPVLAGGDTHMIPCNVNGDKALPNLGTDQDHKQIHIQQQQEQQQQQQQEEEESGLPVSDQPSQVLKSNAHAEQPMLSLEMDQGHEQQQLQCTQQQQQEEVEESGLLVGNPQVVASDASGDQLSPDLDRGHMQGGTQQQQAHTRQQQQQDDAQQQQQHDNTQKQQRDDTRQQQQQHDNTQQQQQQQQQHDNTQQQQQQKEHTHQQQKKVETELGPPIEEEPHAASAGHALQPNVNRASSNLCGMMCEMQLHHGPEQQQQHHHHQQQPEEFSDPGLKLPDDIDLHQNDVVEWVPDTEQQQQHGRQQLQTGNDQVYEGQQQQQHGLLAESLHAVDMISETPAAAQPNRQQRAAAISAVLPPQQQQQQPLEDDLKLNRQLQFDHPSLMSPPPARTPGSALARRSSMQSAARTAVKSGGGSTVKFRPGSSGPAAAASGTAAAAAAGGAAAGEVAGSGRCTWEADDVRDLNWQFLLATSSSSKPSGAARSAAAAPAAGSGGLSKVLDRSGKQLHTSGSSGGGGGVGLGLGFKTPGSDDLGVAAAGFKRRRRSAQGGRRAIVLTQIPGDDDSPPTAAAAAAAAAEGLAEGLSMQDGGKQLQQQQQPEGRLKKRRLQPGAAAAAAAGPSKRASGLYAAKQQQQHRAAKPAATAVCDDEEGVGWVARKKARMEAAAAVVVAAKRNNRRCVFIDEAAADSSSGGNDESDDDDDNDNDDLSGFIASATETPSAATDRSTPAMALYHRSMHTQTPLNSNGKVDMWAILHGRNRARPERYQRHKEKDRQQHGQHTTAATAGGWHNARSKPPPQQQQPGAGYLLDSPDNDDPIDGEPYGLTLQDTPSDVEQAGTDLDEYETEDEVHSGQNHSGEVHSQEVHSEEVHSGDESDRELLSEQQDGWEVHGERQQRKKRRKHQLVSESEDFDVQPPADNATVGQRGIRQADRSGDRGLTRTGTTAPGAVDDAGRGADDVILLDSSSGDCSEGSSGDGDTESDNDGRAGMQGQQQQQRRQQPRQLPRKVPAAVAAAAVPTRRLQPGSKRRQVIASSDSEDAPELPCKRRRGGTTKPPTGRKSDGDSDGQELSGSDDQDDGHFDECNICGEQGELLMCDAPDCPLSYHVECVGLRKVPDGDWICPACRGQLQE